MFFKDFAHGVEKILERHINVALKSYQKLCCLEVSEYVDNLLQNSQERTFHDSILTKHVQKCWIFC